MKQIFNAAVICLVALSACTTPFKKAKDGSQYKIISNKKGPKVIKGNFIEMNSFAKYKDSVLSNSVEDGMPQYAMYDTTSFPEPFKEIFQNIHVGDSITIKISTDSIIAKAQGQAPPFMKKGQFIIQSFTILNSYTTKEQADSSQKVFMAGAQKRDSIAAISQLAKDSKSIEEFLAKNKITAVKAGKGTYVQILEPGTGTLTDSSILMVNYTGKSMDGGAAFDSNTDSSFQHVEPYPIDMRGPQVIQGWIDGLKMMKKGGKAKFYVPSTLGYGKRGNGEKIKPNDNLVFDIAVVDIIAPAQYAAMMKKKQEEQMAQQRMMQQMQQQMQQQPQQQQPQTGNK
jgi:FKBP-type peptidyl-prolyl cis-trans isomerase FkpA